MRKKAVNVFIRAQAVTLDTKTKTRMSMDEITRPLNISKTMCLQRHPKI